MRISHVFTASCSLLTAASAFAQPQLTAFMTVDNEFRAFVTQDPTINGQEFASGGNWQGTFEGSVLLDSPGTWYLHIIGRDLAPPAMMIGTFSLNSADAAFANGTQTLQSNPIDWTVNNTGFGDAMVAATDLGINGTGPWGVRPQIDSSARFIWDAANSSTVYFSTTIRVVPAPGVAALGMLAGLATMRRRR